MSSNILTPRPKTKTIEIEGELYDVIPDVLNEAANYLMIAYKDLGQPTTVFSEAGEKMLKVIFATWQDIFPRESKQWIKNRERYKKSEKSIKEQVKEHTGRNLASIPLYVYKMMGKFFTDDEDQNRDYYLKLAAKFPEFRLANRV